MHRRHVIAMQDRFGRTIDYLRISLADRCNLHCVYSQTKNWTYAACCVQAKGAISMLYSPPRSHKSPKVMKRAPERYAKWYRLMDNIL